MLHAQGERSSGCLRRAATVYEWHQTNIRLQSPSLELAVCSRTALINIACWKYSSRPKLKSNFKFLLGVLKLAAQCTVTLCFLYSQRSSTLTCWGWFTLSHIWIVLWFLLSYLKSNYLPKLGDPVSTLGGRNWSCSWLYGISQLFGVFLAQKGKKKERVLDSDCSSIEPGKSTWNKFPFMTSSLLSFKVFTSSCTQTTLKIPLDTDAKSKIIGK